MLTVVEPAVPVADFSRFYHDEYRTVVGLAYVLSGSRVAAEDLAQEAFIAAYRNWDRIGGYDQPAAWVRHVAANKARSRFRRMRSERKAMQRLEGMEPAVAELSEPATELWAMVRRLPRRQAIAMALTYYADCSIEQIASVMECRPGTVKTHLKRGRAALRAALGQDEEETR